MRLITLAVLLAVAMAAVAPAVAQDAVNLQRSLDKMVELTTSGMSISQVFQKLQAQTGAKFVLPTETMDLLPYGDQTRLEVELKNGTLRKALSPMLTPLALSWTVEGDVVRIVPKEALFRLGRRATREELLALGALYSVSLQPVDKGGSVLDQLRKITGCAKMAFAFPPLVDSEAAMKKAEIRQPQLASDWLDRLCQAQGLTWYVKGDEVVILEAHEQVERQLQKVVSLKYENAQLAAVLVDLVKQARVKLVVDPGVMLLLPHETRDNFNLVMSDATVAQAFEVIAGATGLRFHATSEGVLVDASARLQGAATAASNPTVRPSRPFVVRMNMPGPGGTNIEVYLSPSELPDDVVDAIQAEKVKLIDRIRLSIPTRPAPTTAPAKPPVEAPATPTPKPTPVDTGGVG